MKTLLRNFLNTLRRFKVATTLNILGLSIAFAAFILIMMQVKYDHNFNKQITNADRIFRLEIIGGNNVQAPISRPIAEIFFQSSPHIQAGTLTSYVMERVFEVERNGSRFMYTEPFLSVTPDFPDVFTFEMTEGNTKSLEEPDRVLIPESMARRLFNEESAIDKQLRWEEKNFYVTGVYKDFPANCSVKNVIYCSMQDDNKNQWGNYSYVVHILLDHAENADNVIDNYKLNYGEELVKARFGENSRTINPRLISFKDLHYIKNVDYDPVEKSSQQTVTVLFTIALVLIIIGIINFTNFSMALTPMRVKSINTQKVMGAGVGMLRRTLLAEAFTICMVSYLLSLGFVWLFTKTNLNALVDGSTSFSHHSGLILLTAGIAIVVSLIAGLYPAHYVTSFSPALVLKGNFGLSAKGRTLRNVLIGFQYVSSFALIIGAIFMYMQNRYMQTASLGYTTDQIIVVTMNSSIHKNRDAFINDIQSFAGIESATFSVFLLSGQDRYMGWGRKYKDEDIQFQCLPVDPDFLSVMDIPVVEGRNFRLSDEQLKNGAFIFNERAKSDFNLEIGDKIENMEIIGFMPDIKYASYRLEVEPMGFYVWGTENWGQQSQFAYIKVNAGTDLRTAMQHVNTTLQKFDPGYPFHVRFFDNVLQQLYEKESKMTLLITLFSLVAVLISMMGVFGLVLFESQYKLKEIALRKVMGSTTMQILIMFNNRYIKLVVVCFLIGAPIAYVMLTEWLNNFAYRIPLYWWVFFLSFVLLLLITIITVMFQNRRAANVNPIEIIKTE